MKNFAILTKLNLSQYFGASADKKERKVKRIIITILAICALPILALICVGLYFLGGYALKNNQGQSLLASVMMMAQVLVFFTGATSFLGIMYHSKDNEFLCTLPVSTLSIFLSKFTVVYLSSLITSTLILVPSMITIAVAGGLSGVALGAGYYIFGIVGVLITPVLPLFVVAILSLPIAYIARLFKRNNILSVIFGLGMFIGLMSVYMVFIMSINKSAAAPDSDANISQLMEHLLKSLSTMSKIVYPNIWLANAMVGQKVAINASIYLAVIVGVGAVTLLLAGWMYRKNSIKFIEVGYSKVAKDRVISSKSQVKAMLFRDIKTCMRDTSTAVNSVSGILMAPLMVGIFGYFAKSMPGGAIYGTLMTFLMGTITLASSNYLALIAISREGEKFYMVKYMPINVDEYLKAKRILAMCYVIAGSILVGIVGAIANWNSVNCIFLPINSILFGTFASEWAIMSDLKKPNLNWLNIKQTMRGRMSTLKPMVVGVAETLALGTIIMLMSLSKASTAVQGLVAWSIITLVNLSMMLVMSSILTQRKNHLFNAIEASNG